jgi:hypothetical protein
MVRVLSSLGLALILASALVAGTKGKDVTLTGYIMDNMCSSKHEKDANFADQVNSHPKSCALMEPCVKAGYALYADGKLYKLDKTGNAKVAELLKATKSEKGLQVKAVGSLDGDTLHVKTLTEESS